MNTLDIYGSTKEDQTKKSHMPKTRRRSSSTIELFLLLPEEVLFHLLCYLEDFYDCVRLSLASPRIGLSAIRNKLPCFTHPLFAMAMGLEMIKHFAQCRGFRALNVGFGQELLRKYAMDARMSTDTFPWIRKHSPSCYLTFSEVSRWQYVRLRLYSKEHTVRISCAQMGVDRFYEGEKGKEHLVQIRHFGIKRYYTGKKGQEHLVRIDFRNRINFYFEGKRNMERVAEVHLSNGNIKQFEGEGGKETIVKGITTKGCIVYPNEEARIAENKTIQSWRRLLRVEFLR